MNDEFYRYPHLNDHIVLVNSRSPDPGFSAIQTENLITVDGFIGKLDPIRVLAGIVAII
jgi:hypothetical protein